MAKDRYDYTHYTVPDSFIAQLLNDKPPADSQELLELRDRLYSIVVDTAKTLLNQNQRELIDLYYIKGLNTNEIADLQGKNQSTIYISIHGRDGKNGSIRKLREHLLTLPEVQDILQQIRDLLCL
jgi:DNA-directed RNA polymerase specialized sigma24 family protein